MEEKPILFTGEMVRAVLDGRKTQTRRVIKPQPGLLGPKDIPLLLYYCPYGQPGDRLWVRESWSVDMSMDHLKPSDVPEDSIVYYRANTDKDWERQSTGQVMGKKRPSIFMPRWASRINLEITDIRVERVQDITEEDAKAEGVDWYPAMRANRLFQSLWDSINAKRGYAWDVNPWVWVVEFIQN